MRWVSGGDFSERVITCVAPNALVFVSTLSCLGRLHRKILSTPYPPSSSISCGKCSSPCCGNFRRFSPENLRESFEKFSWTFSQDFRKIFFRTFPFKILKDFKVKVIKIFSKRAVLTFSHRKLLKKT